MSSQCAKQLPVLETGLASTQEGIDVVLDKLVAFWSEEGDRRMSCIVTVVSYNDKRHMTGNELC